jgi:hypothetical protein
LLTACREVRAFYKPDMVKSRRNRDPEAHPVPTKSGVATALLQDTLLAFQRNNEQAPTAIQNLIFPARDYARLPGQPSIVLR